MLLFSKIEFQIMLIEGLLKFTRIIYNKFMSKMEKKKDGSVVIKNKRAFHEYMMLENYTAGLVLTGTEIKSIRAGKVTLTDSYAKVEKGEVWLFNCHISHYDQGNRYNHKIDRPRKLLLNKFEIRKLASKAKESSLTIVPLKIFFNRGWAKIEIALAKGKQTHDKRSSLAEKTTKREIERAMKGNF